MPQYIKHASTLGWTLLLVALSIGLYIMSSLAIFASTSLLPLFGVVATSAQAQKGTASSESTKWYAPNKTQLNDLDMVVNTAGVYGFIFNGSNTLPSNDYYGGYNWCNMPHVNTQSYVKAPEEYVLEYVEVVRMDRSNSLFTI